MRMCSENSCFLEKILSSFSYRPQSCLKNTNTPRIQEGHLLLLLSQRGRQLPSSRFQPFLLPSLQGHPQSLGKMVSQAWNSSSGRKEIQVWILRVQEESSTPQSFSCPGTWPGGDCSLSSCSMCSYGSGRCLTSEHLPRTPASLWMFYNKQQKPMALGSSFIVVCLQV